MNFQARKIVLLTGAGFTHNFGGFLAPEMWGRILNSQEIKAYPSLVHLLKDDLDYESAYHEVMYGNYSSEEKRAFTRAVTIAYEQLDKVVCEFTWRQGSQYPVNIYGVNNFIRCFAGKGNIRGYFFTLNQDLFIDRRLRHGLKPDDEPLIIPGLPHHLRDISPAERNRALTPEDNLQVPSNDEMAPIIASNDGRLSSSGRFHYIKLHGSLNWRSSDGSGVMVIGRYKLEQIGGEPLLNWYFETFRGVLSRGEMSLFIIGYGFRDQHINETIAHSIAQHALKWYATYPIDHYMLRELIFRDPEYGQTLWDGLEGYYPKALKDIYPEDRTEVAREIEELIQGMP